MAAGSADALQKQRSRQEEVFRTAQVSEQKQVSAGAPALMQEQRQDDKKSILRPDDALTAGFIEAASKRIGSVGADDKADGSMNVRFGAVCRSRKSLFFRQRQQWLKNRT